MPMPLNAPFRPVTDTYVGPASFDFLIMDNGKVGIGRTFYRLDNGPEIGATKLFVDDSIPGEHLLEYWSKDQSGNVETPKSFTFTIVKDTTAPVTTTNLTNNANYSSGLWGNLTATDSASTLGVKKTYYSLNGGSIKTGTRVWIPASTSATTTHTLRFWSEDWSGNVETEKQITFTMRGKGTLRLVFGDADSPTGYTPDYRFDYSMIIIKMDGTVVATRDSSSTGSNWNGNDDFSLPASTTPYTVEIEWYWSDGEEEGYDTFPANVNAGQTTTIHY
jgi:hypothetical protein